MDKTPKIAISSGYNAGLDALRGVLALWVVIYHIDAWTFSASNCRLHGGYAVDGFAMLSGLLIYSSVSHVTLDARSIKNYVMRRVLRIYPLYIAIVALILAAGFTTQVNSRIIIENVLLARAFGAKHYANPVAWSLYCEEIFYAVSPIIAVTLKKYDTAFIFCVLVASMCALQIAQFRELRLVPFFCVGMLLTKIRSWK